MQQGQSEQSLLAVQATRIAKRFHERYERMAPRYGYETRAESAVPWEDLPDANKRLMIGVVKALLAEGTINP
jgi:hypothetical protein